LPIQGLAVVNYVCVFLASMLFVAILKKFYQAGKQQALEAARAAKA